MTARLPQPHIHLEGVRGGDTKSGEGDLIKVKVKNKLTLKFILGDLKHF